MEDIRTAWAALCVCQIICAIMIAYTGQADSDDRTAMIVPVLIIGLIGNAAVPFRRAPTLSHSHLRVWNHSNWRNAAVMLNLTALAFLARAPIGAAGFESSGVEHTFPVACFAFVSAFPQPRLLLFREIWEPATRWHFLAALAGWCILDQDDSLTLVVGLIILALGTPGMIALANKSQVVFLVSYAGSYALLVIFAVVTAFSTLDTVWFYAAMTAPSFLIAVNGGNHGTD